MIWAGLTVLWLMACFCVLRIVAASKRLDALFERLEAAERAPTASDSPPSIGEPAWIDFEIEERR